MRMSGHELIKWGVKGLLLKKKSEWIFPFLWLWTWYSKIKHALWGYAGPMQIYLPSYANSREKCCIISVTIREYCLSQMLNFDKNKVKSQTNVGPSDPCRW